jgi:hypothetical protein
MDCESGEARPLSGFGQVHGSADNPATISREAQQQDVIAATLALLVSLGEGKL